MRLEPALPGRQGRLLFSYLALHRERHVRRDELLEVLSSGGAAPSLDIADGGLLPGLEAEWIDAKRTELADLRLELLEVVASCGTQLGGSELLQAEQAARAAVEAAPFRPATTALSSPWWAGGTSSQARRRDPGSLLGARRRWCW